MTPQELSSNNLTKAFKEVVSWGKAPEDMPPAVIDDFAARYGWRVEREGSKFKILSEKDVIYASHAGAPRLTIAQ